MRNQKDINEIEEIVTAIKPLLAGRKPEVQGAILCELLALWIAGHGDHQARAQLLDMHFKAVREMIPISERELFGPKGHPAMRGRVQ